MKKVKFSKNGRVGKWLYVTLCIGVVAISAATVAGYRHAMNSLTDNLVNNEPNEPLEDIDYSEVDAILKDIEKIQVNGIKDWSTIKNRIKDTVHDFVYSKTRRNPMVIPIISEV